MEETFVVYEVEVAFDVERKGRGDEAVVPGSLDVVGEGEDGIRGGAG